MPVWILTTWDGYYFDESIIAARDEHKAQLIAKWYTSQDSELVFMPGLTYHGKPGVVGVWNEGPQLTSVIGSKAGKRVR